MELKIKFKFNDEQIDFLRRQIKQHNKNYNLYVVLGWLIDEIFVSKNANLSWWDNKYSNIFKKNTNKDDCNFVNDEYKAGYCFPLTSKVLIRARLFLLSQNDFSDITGIKHTDQDILMAHYLLLVIDHEIEIEIRRLGIEDGELDHRTALHVEQPALPDDPLFEETYEALQIANYFFYNGEKDFSFLVYCSSLLISLAEKWVCIDAASLIEAKIEIETKTLNNENHDFSDFWKYMFVLRDEKIYFPLGKFSFTYFEQYCKSLIVKREALASRNPNDIISTLWTGRKEFMLERLIKKNEQTRLLKVYSENSIRKRQDIFNNFSDHKWMGKNASFTPDIMIEEKNIWYIFDLKIVHFESKYFDPNSPSYTNMLISYAEAIRKLIDLRQKDHTVPKVHYFISNALVHYDIWLRDIIVKNLKDTFYKKYLRDIPTWINLSYISLKRFEQWLGSDEINFKNLFLYNSYNQYIIPAAGLLTDEMRAFYDSKLNTEFLYGIKND